MPILLTLIVPFYINAGNISIALKSIESALKKVDSRLIEILFVNNNSIDGTELFVCEFIEKNYGSKLIHEKMQGVSHARNSGIASASGNFIAFLDADDEVEVDYFIDIIRSLNSDTDIIIVKHNSFDLIQATKTLPVNLLLKNELNGWWNWQFVFKKSLSSGLKFKGDCFEDFGFFPLILNRAEKCIVLERGLYHYKENASSLTKRALEWRISELLGQFEILRLSPVQLGNDIYKRVHLDFYQHISLLRAMAGNFPVLGMSDSFALLRLAKSWRSRLEYTKRLFLLNVSTLTKPIRSFLKWSSR